MMPSAALDALSDAVCRVDDEGVVTGANAAALALFGRQEKELVGESLASLLYRSTADDQEERVPIQTIISCEKFSAGGDVVCRRPDGTAIPVSYTVAPVSSEGSVSGGVIVLRRHPDEDGDAEVISQQEARHRALLKALPDSIIHIRVDGEVLEYHPPSGAQRTAPDDAFTGKTVRDIVGEDLATRALAHARRAIETGVPQHFEFEWISDEGSFVREARFSAVGEDEAVAVLRDVTDARHAEEALREREHRYRAIFDAMFQFTWLTAPDGAILEINDAALRFAGVSADEVVGGRLWDGPWWQISKQTQHDLREAVARASNGAFVRYEVDLLGSGNHVATVDFSIKPVHDETGDVIFLVIEGRDVTEQKDSERALKHSQRLLAGITNASRDGIVALRALRGDDAEIVDFEWLFANPNSADFTGVDPESLLGEGLLTTLSGPIGRDLFDECVQCVASGQPVECELYYAGDGEERYIQSTAVALGDGCVLTLRDVSEHRIREERLRASQLQLIRAQAIAHLGSWEWDPQTTELHWSDELYRIYGLTPGDPVSFERYLSMVVPEDRAHIEAAVAEALEYKQPFSFEERIRRTDGVERVLFSSGEVVVDDDGYMLVMGVCRDVTDMRRAEQQLRESEQRFRQLAEQMTDLVGLHDADGTYVYASPSCERILGLAPHDLIGKKVVDMLHPDDRRRLVESEQHDEIAVPDDTAVRMQNADGEWVWLEFLTTILRADDGTIASYQTSARDVTERVVAQQEAARSSAVLAQRNRELQDFAYVASHDLQEPLRKIRAFADLLNDEYAQHLDEEGQLFLSRVKESAHRMSTLISDLLAYSRVSTHVKPYERIYLNDVVDEVVNDLEYLIRDVDGTVHVEGLPEVEAERTQMRQLIQNLIGNALKFRRPDVAPVVKVMGRIVDGALHPRGEVQRIAEVTVTDNGIGFNEKYLDRIFTPFQRLHSRKEYAGTGMGLAICRRIVERHGGTISATSRPGAGTTFIVRLPVSRS